MKKLWSGKYKWAKRILLIQPEPTYLGDRIPIHGTGTVTNDSYNEN
jgi:hypothetical protein